MVQLQPQAISSSHNSISIMPGTTSVASGLIATGSQKEVGFSTHKTALFELPRHDHPYCSAKLCQIFPEMTGQASNQYFGFDPFYDPAILPGSEAISGENTNGGVPATAGLSSQLAPNNILATSKANNEADNSPVYYLDDEQLNFEEFLNFSPQIPAYSTADTQLQQQPAQDFEIPLPSIENVQHAQNDSACSMGSTFNFDDGPLNNPSFMSKNKIEDNIDRGVENAHAAAPTYKSACTGETALAFAGVHDDCEIACLHRHEGRGVITFDSYETLMAWVKACRQNGRDIAQKSERQSASQGTDSKKRGIASTKAVAAKLDDSGAKDFGVNTPKNVKVDTPFAPNTIALDNTQQLPAAFAPTANQELMLSGLIGTQSPSKNFPSDFIGVAHQGLGSAGSFGQQKPNQQNLSMQTLAQQNLALQNFAQPNLAQQNLLRQNLAQQSLCQQFIDLQNLAQHNAAQQKLKQQSAAQQNRTQQGLAPNTTGAPQSHNQQTPKPQNLSQQAMLSPHGMTQTTPTASRQLNIPPSPGLGQLPANWWDMDVWTSALSSGLLDPRLVVQQANHAGQLPFQRPMWSPTTTNLAQNINMANQQSAALQMQYMASLRRAAAMADANIMNFGSPVPGSVPPGATPNPRSGPGRPVPARPQSAVSAAGSIRQPDTARVTKNSSTGTGGGRGGNSSRRRQAADIGDEDFDYRNPAV